MGDVVRMRPEQQPEQQDGEQPDGEQPDGGRAPEPLWREAAGAVLRERRHERGERLVETAERAGISTQYLSEVERGVKDPSSEVLAAVAGALGLRTLDLTVGVARQLQRHSQQLSQQHRATRPSGPVALAA